MVDLTIAIPTINRCKQLERAINSCLCQRFSGSFEILVSNNVSSDGTEKYLDSLEEPNIKVFHQANRLNMRDNWQFLLQKAAGHYFLLLSDDDWFASNQSLQKLMEPFTDYCSLSASISNVTIMQANRSTFFYPKTSGYLSSNKLLKYYFRNDIAVYPAATVLRTEDVIKNGGYGSCKTTNAIDAEILLKTSRGRYVYYEATPLVNYTLQYSQTNLPPMVAELDCDYLIKLTAGFDTTLTKAVENKKKLAVYGFVVRNFRTGNLATVILFLLRNPINLTKLLNMTVVRHLIRKIRF